MEGQPTRWERLKNLAWAATKPIRWLASFFNPQDPSTSMKRGNMAISSIMLSWGFAKVVKAIADAIAKGGHATMGDVFLVAVISLPLASLAGAAYLFRRDGTFSVGSQEPPPQKPEGASE